MALASVTADFRFQQVSMAAVTGMLCSSVAPPYGCADLQVYALRRERT